MTEATIESIERKRSVLPFLRQETGWLYSTPVSKKSVCDPVREEFFSAVGGEIIRRWRKDINEPFQYEVFHGYLDISLVGVITPAKEIKRLLEKEKLLSEDDTDIFIQILRSVFSLFRWEIENDLKKEIGGRLNETHPLIAHLRLDQNTEIMETIAYNMSCIFFSMREKVFDFMARHFEELMTVKVVRKFKVIRA